LEQQHRAVQRRFVVMMNWLRKLVGDTNERSLKPLWPLVAEINDLEPTFEQMSDDDLRAKTDEFRARLHEGETTDDLMPEAFATVREAARRTIGQRHYDVQLIGGIALHKGNIAEMRTGEGKTLVATLPLYLNALEGKGCHLVTVNDYLAKVGAGWMGPIYHRLGLSIGFIAHEYSALYDPDFIDPNANQEDQRLVHWRACTRREAYAADITYGTNNEFGFDYLRDNMAIDKERMVQHGHHYAIVDEVDNILIDEARTPLIISGPAQKSSDEYKRMAGIIRGLNLRASTVSAKEAKDGVEHDGDYVLDARSRSITLTEEGIEKVERALGIPADESLYDPQYFGLTPYLENALKAQFVFQRDKDYMLTRDGEVVIVDEFTGRAMPGRRWSDGLHQAVEAKEGTSIRNENITMATITFQNYFRMYDRLAGMTGTAYTEREEFAKIYNLEVVVIPTHKPTIRNDMRDQIYRTEDAKFNAVVREVKAMHEEGRPALIGTTSVETSERLSELLRRYKVPHSVLNAKQHEREASIVTQAGRVGAVTVATNMAGRGTDILLGGNPEGLVEDILEKQGVKLEEATPEQRHAALEEARTITEAERKRVLDLGGMHIVGTERHEARRIDNQLRGRAGRQGDPGSSRFYISLEDELMQRFGRMDTIKKFMNSLSSEDAELPIESRWLDKAIESAQNRVEGFNFDIRKHTVEFDDVMNRQRQIIYADRQAILEGQDMHERVLEMMGEEIAGLIDDHLPPEDEEFWDIEALLRAFKSIDPLLSDDLTPESLHGKERDEIEGMLIDLVEQAYQEREQAIGADNMRYVERRMMLGAIDRQWVDYLTAMDALRQSINLQAYAQRDPLIEFKRHSFGMFEELKDNITHDIVYQILPATFRYEEHLQRIREEQERRLAAAKQGSAEQQRATRTVRKEVRMPGRNELCPCGSGRKFKYCHIDRQDEIMHLIQQGGPAATVSAQLATGSPSAPVARRDQEAAKIAAAVGGSGIAASEAGSDSDTAAGGDGGASQESTKPTPRGRAAPPAAQGGGNGSKGGKKKKEKSGTPRGKQQPARKR
jgi:preprotein translocase subunit SecA